ncbi:N,N-dimethylformamidase beta subunit family domain-containing protein [Bradyrhizobium sp. USDA 3315]
MDIQAYFEEWSCEPGDVVRLAISTPHATVRASLVRLVSGPGRDEAIEGKVVDFSSVLDRTVSGGVQSTVIGSHAEFPLPSPINDAAISVHCWAWPTVPERSAPQAIWSIGDVALVIISGGLALRMGSATLAVLPDAIIAKHWYSILTTIGDGEVCIDLRRLDAKVGAQRTLRAATGATANAATLLLAAAGIGRSGSPLEPYNGKIDSPTLHLAKPSAEMIAAWHAGKTPTQPAWAAWKLGRDFASETIEPDAGGEQGHLVNGVERGVTGRNWDGRSDSFVEVPEQYCALQFHDDDMVDAGWRYNLEFRLPEDLQSGVYAVRLEAGGRRNHFPLFVRPVLGTSAPVLFLVPTNTYLAYANDHLASLDFSSVMPHDKVVPEDEQYLFSHPEPGRSCYDTHADGTPVRYSGRRRPLFNVRPGFPNWLTGSYRHFPVDMYIVEWLEHLGIEYHVATDEDFERGGRNLADRYAAIVTGSHPEYWTRTGLDILDGYLHDGGRVMYLGGNGFYWVTSRLGAKPWVIEVRRDNSGTRCWDAPYGERTHVATTEAGGIWRTRGRAPNKMLGVGFASEGWSKGCGYRRLEASYNSPAAKLFDGITEEIVGDYGYVLGGAVGDEVDRYDVTLGSPEHAYVLGTSTGLGNEYQLVIEDLTLSLPDQGGAQRPDVVRSDMVLFPIDGGGWVFSVGSIAYAGALAWNGCDNGLSRLTANILRAFTGKEPVLGA